MIDKNRFELVDGKLEEVGGAIKRTVGRILGDDTLEAQGEAEVVEGQERRAAAKTAEQLKGAVEIVAGVSKEKIGALVGNDKLEKEGKKEAKTGEARQKANK